jgi:hypothetical protein
MPGCCVHSGCIRRKHDAAKATKKRSDEGRRRYRPVVTLTHSAGLVNRSLPVTPESGCAMFRKPPPTQTRVPRCVTGPRQSRPARYLHRRRLYRWSCPVTASARNTALSGGHWPLAAGQSPRCRRADWHSSVTHRDPSSNANRRYARRPEHDGHGHRRGQIRLIGAAADARSCMSSR